MLPANVTQEQAGVRLQLQTALKPGLYQVRAAVRDEKNGKVGSAQQWIEIPDLSARHLTLSSLLVRPATTEKKPDETATSPAQPQFSVDRRFPRTSQLSFLLFIYNATRGANGASAPEVTAQVEVFRKGKAIISTAPRKLSTQGIDDLARIPYGGGQFRNIAVGRYDLQITITDNIANASASQRLSFQ